MWTDQALQKLPNKIAYCREDLLRILRSEKADLSDSAFRWTLYNLLREQKLFKTEYDTYVTVKPAVLPVYKPYYSEKANTLMGKLSNQYQDLEFVIFESRLLNEFLKHQIAQNIYHTGQEFSLKKVH